MIKHTAVFLVFALLVSCSPALAETGPQVIDSAGVMGNSAAIQAEISRIYQEYNAVVVIETLDSLAGKDPDKLARDRFFELGLDREGIPVLNALILYAEKDKRIRIAHAENCGLNKWSADDILKALTRDISNGSLDDGFLKAAISLEDEIAGRTGEGLLCPVNQRDMSLYQDKTVFLVSDEDWRDVLRLVPVALWSRDREACQDIYDPEQGIENHKCSYPLLIYHREGEAFDADSILWFLEQHRAGRAIVVGNPPQDLVNLLGARLGEDGIKRIEPGDYISFWFYSKQAVVSEDDYKTAMMASVFASYINAPLFVLDKDFSPEDVRDKELICVGSVPGLDCGTRLNLEGLQKRYKAMTGSDKAILVNPRDIENGYCEDLGSDEGYKPEWSPAGVSRLFCRDSLAAPVLAAAKDEAIIFSETEPAPGMLLGLSPERADFRERVKSRESTLVSISENVKGDVEEAFKRLSEPKYLTIMAGPKAIPFSRGIGDLEGEYYRESLDRYYSDTDGDGRPDIAFGRIFTRTVSGASSYVARDILNLRSARDSALFVFQDAANGSVFYPSMAESLRKKGYDVSCYGSNGIIEGYSVPVCKPGTLFEIPGAGEFENKEIIGFSGNGNPVNWHGTIRSKDLPDLDSSLIIAKAPSTSDYYMLYAQKGLSGLFSATALERGAIAYFGMVGVGGQSDYYRLSPWVAPDEAFLRLLFFNEQDLGSISMEVLRNTVFRLSDYTLLGDPTVRVEVPELSWQYGGSGEGME